MFYIVAKENGKWTAYGYDDFSTMEDAMYQMDALKEVDRRNGEHHEYKVVSVTDAAPAEWYTVNWLRVGKTESVMTTHSKVMAIKTAREYHSMCAPWERVEISINDSEKLLPYRVFIVDTDYSEVLDEVKGMPIDDAIAQARSIIKRYNNEEPIGVLHPFHYDIVDEDGDSYMD